MGAVQVPRHKEKYIYIYTYKYTYIWWRVSCGQYGKRWNWEWGGLVFSRLFILADKDEQIEDEENPLLERGTLVQAKRTWRLINTLSARSRSTKLSRARAKPPRKARR